MADFTLKPVAVIEHLPEIAAFDLLFLFQAGYKRPSCQFYRIIFRCGQFWIQVVRIFLEKFFDFVFCKFQFHVIHLLLSTDAALYAGHLIGRMRLLSFYPSCDRINEAELLVNAAGT